MSMASGIPRKHAHSLQRRYTNLHSKIERGDEEEATQAYILVRRGDDDEVNKVI